MSNTGEIKSFNPDKGFGFIIGPDGDDVFCHIKACTDGAVPQKGDTVSFDMEPSQSKPGQMTATNVTGGSGTAGGRVKGTGAHTGTCKSFSPKSGFGFIIGEDGQDIFLHVKGMVDGSQPNQGDMLQFDVEPSATKPGQMQAINVTGGSGFQSMGWGKGFGKDKGKGKGGPYGGGFGGGWGGPPMMWGKGDPWGGKGGMKGWGPWGKGW
jgi:CspA family cold shock protein